MNNYLVFEIEANAVTALESIYANMVKAIDSFDLLDVATDTVVPKDDLSPDEAVQVNASDRRFPVFGVNARTRQKDVTRGYTTAWAIPQQTLQGKWVFPKPDDALLEGVSNYTTEPYNIEWFPLTTLES